MATIAELTKKLADQDAVLVAKYKEIAELKAGGTGDNLQMQATIATKDAEIIDLKAQLGDAVKIIEEQHVQLSKEEDALETDAVIVTVDKKKYRVAMPKFNVGGVEVTAAQLKEDKELAARLVKQGSGILELLTKE